MRLINTQNLRLEEHNDQDLPAYAILSHRWYDDDQEVSFRDLQDGRNVAHKRGFRKLERFCQLAKSLHYKYAWSDVCCINKDSDTELKTALNSMYRWYAMSDLCIAYLEDVRRGGWSLEQSQWFKRGWTLQELIAPRKMYFYDGDWNCIGNRTDLIARLSQITGIQEMILNHQVNPSSCSIAQRMSWAAGRVTKRVEDRAYSLLGIFGITMETVYDGDGERAFFQLQEKIIEHSADQSIFTWAMDNVASPQSYAGMFAPSPDCFASCDNIVPTRATSGFSLENIGLSINLLTLPYALETHLAFLDCMEVDNPDSRVGILITKHWASEQFTRIRADDGKNLFVSCAHELRDAQKRKLYIQSALPEEQLRTNLIYGFQLRGMNAFQGAQIRVLSRAPTRVKGEVRLEPGQTGTAGVVGVGTYTNHAEDWAAVRWIKLGFIDDFTPAILLARDDSHYLAAVGKYEFQALESAPRTPRTAAVAFDNDWLRPGGLIASQTRPSYDDLWKQGYCILVPKILPELDESMIYNDFEALGVEIQISLLPADPNMKGAENPHQRPYVYTIDFLYAGNVHQHGRWAQKYKKVKEHPTTTMVIGAFLTSVARNVGRAVLK